MNNRVMRLIVFFDLPFVTTKDLTEYRNFRRFLLKNGFIMMQESVYSKIALNSQQSNLFVEKLRKNAPKKGLIQVLIVTERQYSQIEYIVGKSNSKIIDSEDRLIIL